MRTTAFSLIISAFDRAETLPSGHHRFRVGYSVNGPGSCWNTRAPGTFQPGRTQTTWFPTIPAGSLAHLTVHTKSILASTPTRSDLALMVFIGLFLILLAVAQVARAVPVSTDEGLLDARELAAMGHDRGSAAPADTIPETPCIHHEPGTQCAPCSYCSTPATEVSELLELVGVDVGKQDQSRVKQHFPATVFKPPRQVR